MVSSNVSSEGSSRVTKLPVSGCLTMAELVKPAVMRHFAATRGVHLRGDVVFSTAALGFLCWLEG